MASFYKSSAGSFYFWTPLSWDLVKLRVSFLVERFVEVLKVTLRKFSLTALSSIFLVLLYALNMSAFVLAYMLYYGLIPIKTFGAYVRLAGLSFFQLFFLEYTFGFWILLLLFVLIVFYSKIKKNSSFVLWSVIKNNYYVFFFGIASACLGVLAFYFYKHSFSFKGFFVDYYTFFIKLSILSLFVLILSCSYSYYQRFKQSPLYELPVIYLFLVFFLFFLVSSFDLINVFFCTEGITFCMATLIAYNYNYKDASQGAIKYLILGSTASGLLGFGAALLFGITSTTDFYSLRLYVALFLKTFSGVFDVDSGVALFGSSGNSQLLGFSLALIFLFFGFFFKLSVAPMHQWSIDIYKISNWGLIFLFSTAVKLAFFSVFMKLLLYVLKYCVILWAPIIGFAGALSLFFGSFGAAVAFNFKEFVAFSSLSQIGFLVLGFLSAEVAGFASSNFFFFIYLLAMTVIFFGLSFFSNFIFKLVWGNRCDPIKTRDVWLSGLSKFVSVINFNNLRNFSKNPVIAFCISVAVITLAGLPPFPGFFAKFFLLAALFKKKYFFYAALGLGFSLISIFYYIRVFMLLWLDFIKNIALHIDLDVEKEVYFYEPAERASKFLYYKRSLFSILKFYAESVNNRVSYVALYFFTGILCIFFFFIHDFWTFVLFVTSKGLLYRL